MLITERNHMIPFLYGGLKYDFIEIRNITVIERREDGYVGEE